MAHARPIPAPIPPNVYPSGLPWHLVDKTGECWLWLGRLDRQGYARARSRLGHRVFYELTLGPIPEGLTLDHLCRVRNCVNPDHMEPVTYEENGRRQYRASMTHCANGHEFTPANTYWRPRGGRDCRACGRERTRRYLAKRGVA